MMRRLGTLLFGASLAACAADAAPDQAPTWTIDHIEENGALLSVWGSSPDDVWAAGGQADRGLLLHFDGERWSAVDIDAPELLVWVYGFSAADVYAVGNGGLILHYDGDDWTRVESGTDRPLYGIWGASADDVWIAGGDPYAPAGSAILLRGRGDRFERVTDLPVELAPSAIYKVYGFATNDFIAVGTGGTVLRWDGTWRREMTPTGAPLFSVWGRGADDIYAVGGNSHSEVLHYDGVAWSRIGDETGMPLSGVFTPEDGPAIAVGFDSYVVEVSPDGTDFVPEMPRLAPVPFLHGVWGDGQGTTYAAGGDLFAYPAPMTGVIMRRQ